MRRAGVLAAFVLALGCPAAALAGNAGVPGRMQPGIVDLMALRGHDAALVQLPHGQRLPGAQLVSRRLNIWRLPASRAMRVGLELRPLAVEPDRPLAPQRAAVEPLAGLEWWRGAIGADRASPPPAGKPVTVVDTGLDVSHPEFATRADTTLLDGQSTPAGEDEEHGTAVSSVVAAPDNGIGVVGIYPQAALAEWDSGEMFVSDVIAGIERALDHGRGVINMSFGFDGYDRMLADEIDVAFGNGSLLVAAAGNDFLEGNARHSPASLHHVLTVAATDEQNASSFFSNRSLAIDLAAPGENIPVAVPTWASASGYATADGTSFSAPLVAGAAAWVWTRRPDLDVTQVFDLMRWSATDIDEPGFDEDTGWGLLSVPAALSDAAPPADPHEPNEDVYEIIAGKLFRNADAPLTTPARGRAALIARLDVTEDPEDVYRVWVPARRRVAIRVVPSGDADVELWNAATPSVLISGATRRRHLLAGSGREGRAAESVAFRNRAKRGTYVFLDVYLPEKGAASAEYRVAITTTR
ncbi:MAG: S8 family peptidase [Gaiellaceae bacterium]